MEELIKSQVALLAISNDEEPFRLVGIKTINRGKIRVIIPSIAFESIQQLKKELIRKGFPPKDNAVYWKEIYEVLSKDTKQRFKVVPRAGWWNTCYLSNDGKIYGQADKYGPILSHSKRNITQSECVNGTLKEWKVNVAPFALCSSRLMLALCCALSGIIVRIAGMESGGFHFFGRSSIGKSSTLLFSSSIFSDRSFILTWNVTEKGVEEMAQLFSDTCLHLDELKSAGGNPKIAAQLVQKLTYLLADGKGKLRTSHYENEIAQWRLSVLSTGEQSLNEYLEQGGLQQLAGDKVRLIDIPADAGCGYGIYELLPDNINSSSELANYLESQCQKYHGVVKSSYLKKLVNSLKDDKDGLKNEINHSINYFLKENNINHNIGTEIRTAKRFALAYAAGVLAIQHKILPFHPKDIMKGISKCLHDSIQNEYKQDQNEDYWSKVRQVLKTKKALDLCDPKRNYLKSEIDAANVISCSINRKHVLALKSECLNDLIPDYQVRKSLLRKWVADGVLIQDSEGKNKRPIPYRGKSMARRYCFLDKVV